MTTAPEYQTDYNTTQAQRDAAPSLTRPSQAPAEPFMTMFELDGKWAVRVDGVTAFLPEKHLMANMPAQGIIQAVMSAVNNARDHKNGGAALGSAVLDAQGNPRDLNVPKTDASTMDQGLKTADAKSVGSELAASGAFGQSGQTVTKNPVEPSTNPVAEFAHTSESNPTDGGPGTYHGSDEKKNTYDAAEVERFKDDGKSPVADKKPTTLPPKAGKK